MTDLLSAVITLEALEGGQLDLSQGRAMHAIFLPLVHRAGPDATHHDCRLPIDARARFLIY